MQSFPSLPDLAEAPPALFEHGHLWIQEFIAGAPFRFSLDATGRITFADAQRTIEEPPPFSLRAAIRYVREHLNRDGVREAAPDPTGVVFYGVATRFEGVPYDFARLPPFLGTDIYVDDKGGYLPPDAVERAFDRLGLAPINTLEKEVNAEYFDPADAAVPDSAWYDGPAAGVVYRNKTGDRALARNPEAFEDPESLPEVPAAVAAATVTTNRLQRVSRGLDADDRQIDFDAVYEGILELVGREEHARLPPGLDQREFRSAVAERVEEFLHE